MRIIVESGKKYFEFNELENGQAFYFKDGLCYSLENGSSYVEDADGLFIKVEALDGKSSFAVSLETGLVMECVAETEVYLPSKVEVIVEE